MNRQQTMTGVGQSGCQVTTAQDADQSSASAIRERVVAARMHSARGLAAVRICVGLLVAMLSTMVRGADEDGAKPLFNGKDLTGWVRVNCAPETFTVRDGMIVSTGKPTGVLRTEKMYENFVLDIEWRHMNPKGNAGIFVWSDSLPAPGVPFTRGIEVQVLAGHETENYTSHGDVFAIHGATFKPDRAHPNGWMRCLPSEKRCNPAGEWNHYRIECQSGRIQLAVNGKVVSGGTESHPRVGYLCLESEGSECHFRNLKLKELPSSNPPDSERVAVARDFRSLYTGLDLHGWMDGPKVREHFVPKDWTLFYNGKAGDGDPHLWTIKEYGDIELICDWRWTQKPKKKKHVVILPSGDVAKNAQGQPEEIEVDDGGDSGIYLRGSDKALINIWSHPIGSGEVMGYRNDTSLPKEVRAAVTPRKRADRPIGEWNRFFITLRGDLLTVQLNGETVIERAHLPGLPGKGRIGLHHHGAPIEFANLFVHEYPAK